MFKRLLFSSLSLCLAASVPARAEETQFVCHSEESADVIGAAIVESRERADEVARGLLDMGVCEYLDERIVVYVVRRGTTFGTGSKVTVVGLSRNMDELPDMWGLIPTDELPSDGTI
jgi:hypothetical protein